MFEKTNCEIQNAQAKLAVEIDSDCLEDNMIKPNIRTLPNSSIFSELMTKTLGSLMSSSNCLKIDSSHSSSTNFGVPLYILGGGKLRIHDNVFELTPEIHKALSSTG